MREQAIASSCVHQPHHNQNSAEAMFAFKTCVGFCLVLLMGMASAFVAPSLPSTRVAKSVSSLKMANTYWEGHPPSEVLGPILSKTPSSLLGIASLGALAAGTFCVHESNILNSLTLETVNPVYIVGFSLPPISWGLHVASWIQVCK
jgi:hypothetical protein